MIATLGVKVNIWIWGNTIQFIMGTFSKYVLKILRLLFKFRLLDGNQDILHENQCQVWEYEILIKTKSNYFAQ